jgi:hypothetical protein
MDAMGQAFGMSPHSDEVETVVTVKIDDDFARAIERPTAAWGSAKPRATS